MAEDDIPIISTSDPESAPSSISCLGNTVKRGIQCDYWKAL